MALLCALQSWAAFRAEPYSLQSAVAEVVKAEAVKYNCSIAAAVFSESRGGIKAVAAAGTVSLEPDAPSTTTEDVFIWGSITKVSTGAAILKLAQEGKLSLNDTIPQYVDPMIASMKAKDPSLGFNSSEDLWGPEVSRVTIYHLATMNSGIPDFDTAKPFPPPPKDALVRAAWFELVSRGRRQTATERSSSTAGSARRSTRSRATTSRRPS